MSSPGPPSSSQAGREAEVAAAEDHLVVAVAAVDAAQHAAGQRVDDHRVAAGAAAGQYSERPVALIVRGPIDKVLLVISYR